MLGWGSEVNKVVRKLFELRKRSGDIPIKLSGGLEQLLYERGRY